MGVSSHSPKKSRTVQAKKKSETKQKSTTTKVTKQNKPAADKSKEKLISQGKSTGIKTAKSTKETTRKTTAEKVNQEKKPAGKQTPVKDKKNQSVKQKSKKTIKVMENKSDEVGSRKRGRSDSITDTTEQKKAKLTLVNHSTHLNVGGVVLCLGEGDTGQLGLGPDVMERTKPGKVNIPSEVIQVCAGGMHTVCLTAQGQVYTWGCNDEGALGRKTPDEDECMEPGQVELSDEIVQVCAGDSHTAALTKYGKVFAWGTFRDASGAIGLTTDGKSETPLEVTPNLVVSRIVSGADHIACLTKSGELYTLGNAEQGQLGRVAECFSNRGGRKGLGLLLNPGQVHVKKRSTKFDNVWTGSYVTYAHTTNGDVYSWGLNNYFQLGFNDIMNRYVPECAKSFSNKLNWRELAGGQHHTLALDGNGVVYSLGRKEYGRLGLGENTEEKSEPTVVKALKDKKCINVACGTAVSMAVTNDGLVYAWGMGTSKQLGQTEEDDFWEPVQITGKQLENRKGLQVTSGGQHTVILAQDQ